MRRESRQKDAMINGVKCSRKIKKNKCRNLLLVNGNEQVILYAKKGGFSRMEFAIGRLKGGNGLKR
jgi:hypothetical protein